MLIVGMVATLSLLAFKGLVPPLGRMGPTPRMSVSHSSLSSYLDSLEVHELPAGFQCGVHGFRFEPAELGGRKTAVMNLTVLALDAPTDDWAAVFTRNKFPGAPVKVGRARLAGGGALQAVVINNKISNVCSAGDGVTASEAVCSGVADALKLSGGAEAVLPLSTGVIGWQLPVKRMLEELPAAARTLSAEIFPS